MKKIIYTFGLLSIMFFNGCSSKLSHENLDTVVTVNNKDGLLKDNSEVTIKPIYKKINRFDGNFGRYFHPNYINIHWIENNGNNTYAIVENTDGKYGIINKDGELQLKAIYDSIGRFHNGFAKLEVNKKFGLINEDFEVVVKPIYDEVQEFIYDTIIVKKFGKFGCINKNLELKITPSMDMIYIQHENFKRVELDNKWGFVDNNCNFVTKPIYDYAYDFSNGFAKVKSGNNWGFIDTNGKFLTKPIFEDADRF